MQPTPFTKFGNITEVTCHISKIFSTWFFANFEALILPICSRKARNTPIVIILIVMQCCVICVVFFISGQYAFRKERLYSKKVSLPFWTCFGVLHTERKFHLFASFTFCNFLVFLRWTKIISRNQRILVSWKNSAEFVHVDRYSSLIFFPFN